MKDFEKKGEASKSKKRKSVHFNEDLPSESEVPSSKKAKTSRSNIKEQRAQKSFFNNLLNHFWDFSKNDDFEGLRKFLNECNLSDKKLRMFYEESSKQLIYNGLIFFDNSTFISFLSRLLPPKDIFSQILSKDNHAALRIFSGAESRLKRDHEYNAETKADRVTRLECLITICKEGMDNYIEQHQGERYVSDGFIAEYNEALTALGFPPKINMALKPK